MTGKLQMTCELHVDMRVITVLMQITLSQALAINYWRMQPNSSIK